MHSVHGGDHRHIRKTGLFQNVLPSGKTVIFLQSEFFPEACPDGLDGICHAHDPKLFRILCHDLGISRAAIAAADDDNG